MEHFLNLRAVAAAAAPQDTTASWFYQRLNSAMRGAVGELTEAELDAVKKVLMKGHADVMGHLREIQRKTKKTKAR